jgi:hypothetical protein
MSLRYRGWAVGPKGLPRSRRDPPRCPSFVHLTTPCRTQPAPTIRTRDTGPLCGQAKKPTFLSPALAFSASWVAWMAAAAALLSSWGLITTPPAAAAAAEFAAADLAVT